MSGARKTGYRTARRPWTNSHIATTKLATSGNAKPMMNRALGESRSARVISVRTLSG